uniref:Uncharacterized protein n=1 Tax=Anopheles melas TaxID=34690 RepID=A0A182TPD7_9DIPT
MPQTGGSGREDLAWLVTGQHTYSTYSATFVYTPGTPGAPHFCGPKLTTPIRYHDPVICRISGPPESPLHVSLPRTPPAHICVESREMPLRWYAGEQSFTSTTVSSTFSFFWLAEAVSVLPQPAA